MSDIAISVEKIHKVYRLGLKEDSPDTLAGKLFSLLKAPIRNFRRLKQLSNVSLDDASNDVLWALRDISFDIKRGEVVGIIGRNGAGKSTLLKILSRITEPTSGRAFVNGRLGSLLEVGTGFHPELTGRENTYMNGTILGMTKKEIDRKFDEIVDFSGVEKFLDTPVKRYSSGMQVRLAFAVAAHLDPEILIVDEVLAVGDADFQKKCLGKMEKVSQQGRTVLFVSHNLPAVRNLCSRGILLDKGSIVADAEVESTLQHYVQRLKSVMTIPLQDRQDRTGRGQLRFVDTWLEGQKGNRCSDFISGSRVTFILEYEMQKGHSIRTLEEVAISILAQDGTRLIDLGTQYVGCSMEVDNAEYGQFRCTIDRFPLNVGEYTYHVWAKSSFGCEDFVMEAGCFSVASGDYYGRGNTPSPEWMVMVDHLWEHGMEKTRS